MSKVWQLVQSLRGRTLETPSGRGRFTVTEVDERGVKVQVLGAGTYYVPRAALEAAAGLPDQDLTAAGIRSKGISESQPSYIAAIVRATREPSDPEPLRETASTAAGASKYDAFWTARLDALQILVDRASRGEHAEMDAGAISAFGNRGSWSGNADVRQSMVVSAGMAHMVALARVVTAHAICTAHPDMTFHFTMNSTGRLRAAARAAAVEVSVPPVADASLAPRSAATTRDLTSAGSRPPALSNPRTNPRVSATEACATIHRLLSSLSVYRSPGEVPFSDGLYIFYDRRERSPHADGARIVRIGNHPRRDGRLVGRLKEHYLTRRDAKNGSVFRLLLGGALIRRDDPHSPCLSPGPGEGHWERHMQRECDRCAPYEQRVTDFLQQECAFRCIRVADRAERNRFEALLVATIAECAQCRPSERWLGRYAWSPIVQRSGLWNREFVGGAAMSHTELRRLEQLVAETPGAPSTAVTDLTSTLLLIPCSASKRGWPDPQLPVKRVGDLISPELAQVLEEGRHLAFARTSIDLASPTRPAIATYSGFPYATPGLRELLVSHLRRGLHCLIVSGGYGLVRPEEPIHQYEAHLQQTRGIWSHRIPPVLRDYVRRNDIRRTFGVFSGSYSSVVPSELTSRDWRDVEAFVGGVDEGSPLRVVPRKGWQESDASDAIGVPAFLTPFHLAHACPRGCRRTRQRGLAAKTRLKTARGRR